MQSVVMADVAGRTAFKAVGKLPLRKLENDILGIAPSPGCDARYDWAGWVPYAGQSNSDQNSSNLINSHEKVLNRSFTKWIRVLEATK